MNISLIHPPLDDPTLPYHSNAYLAGHLRHNGFGDVSLRDINVEYVNYCWEKRTVGAFYEEADRRLTSLGGRPRLGFEEQEQYYALAVAPRVDPDDLGRAVAAFRNRETFLDYAAYVENMNRLTRYSSFLGALSYPAEINGFTLKTRGRFSAYSLADLLSADLGEKVCHPFDRFFAERLRGDRGLGDADLFGISVVYDHQLFFAIHLARRLKQTWPHKRIVLGGTAISQLYKYLKEAGQIKRFFKLCDAIVIGEGETAICDIAASGGEFSDTAALTNTITYDPYRDQLTFPAIRYENVGALGTPVYDHPWHLYLSPEKGINYSPTRGCYWNRCTFCDYGLNTDRPTSPWRERRIDQVVSDLQAVQREQGVRYVYLAVDVMAPGYLERLSDALLESGLDIRWSGEIRMEKIFSAERCRKLARSGCVCVSFGMESGNQRILDLIDKGTKVAFMAETMKNFSAAGIAVQLMAFTDFPTETSEEKSATYEFVKENSDHWSAGGIGTFLLTGTSMIARHPERFGITVVETQDADVARAIAYTVDSETSRRLSLTEEADASFDDAGPIFPPILGRPWAGGTDSLHTMIYYEAHGKDFFKEHPLGAPPPPQRRGEDELRRSRLSLGGQLTESAIDFSQIFENRNLFVRYLRERLDVPAEPTYTSFLAWKEAVPAVRAAAGLPTHWLVTPREALRVDGTVYRLLKVAAAHDLTLAQLLGGFGPETYRKVLAYLLELEKRGLLVLVGPTDPGGLRPDVRVVSGGRGSRHVAGKLSPPGALPS